MGSSWLMDGAAGGDFADPDEIAAMIREARAEMDALSMLLEAKKYVGHSCPTS